LLLLSPGRSGIVFAHFPVPVTKKEESTMSLWKEPPQKDLSSKPMETAEPNTLIGGPMKQSTERMNGNPSESFIAPELTIEGKIVGHGSVRIAGRFQGDLQVHGDLHVESGAQVTGEIHADTITIEGAIEGNVTATSQVRLASSGQIIGDVKAKTLTVAAGARMRGKVESGWDDVKLGETKISIASSTAGAGNGSAL
jgi:cytoskeletal protein CcmA (bactofilin family)